MSIGENIKKARGRIKQSELAEMLNVDVSTVSRWENDKNVPNGNIIGQIARVLHTSTEALMGFNETPTSTTSNSQAIKSLADKLNSESIELGAPITGGITNNMFIINDKNSNCVYYLPNNEEGRNLFLSVLSSGLQGTSRPLVSNAINGNNNNGNQLGLINDRKEA